MENGLSMEDKRLHELVSLANESPGQKFSFSGWDVLCTGWKYSLESIDVRLQWIARPKVPIPGSPFDDRGTVVCVGMPGPAPVLLRQGQRPPDGYHFNSVGYGASMLGEDWKAVAERAILRTGEVLLAVIDGFIRFEWQVRNGRPFPAWERVVVWDQLSRGVKATIDVERYLREEFGVVDLASTEEGSAVFNKVHRALFYGGDWPEVEL